VVAFLPFPTKLVTDALHDVGDERVAITIYGLTLLAIRLLSAALDAYARREHLYSPQEEGEELWSAQRKLLPAIIGYVITIAIGLLVPRAAVALYFCLAVYQIVPFGEMTRLLFRRSWLPATPRTLWQAGIPSTSMSGNGWPSGPPRVCGVPIGLRRSSSVSARTMPSCFCRARVCSRIASDPRPRICFGRSG
jgi:hypothetical protein